MTTESDKEERYILSDADRARLELDRQHYDKLAAEQCLSLDKSIIGIAGAAFSVAIAFIDKIIRFDTAFWLWSFWSAMFFLVIAIISTTISFWLSENATSFRRKCVDDCDRTGDVAELDKKSIWDKYLHIINNIRLITFIFGMLLLGTFIFSNGVSQSYMRHRLNDYNTTFSGKNNVKKTEPSIELHKQFTQNCCLPCHH